MAVITMGILQKFKDIFFRRSTGIDAGFESDITNNWGCVIVPYTSALTSPTILIVLSPSKQDFMNFLKYYDAKNPRFVLRQGNSYLIMTDKFGLKVTV